MAYKIEDPSLYVSHLNMSLPNQPFILIDKDEPQASAQQATADNAAAAEPHAAQNAAAAEPHAAQNAAAAEPHAAQNAAAAEPYAAQSAAAAEPKQGPVANARVIIQGFRHKDVLENDLEKESSTLSAARC